MNCVCQIKKRNSPQWWPRHTDDDDNVSLMATHGQTSESNSHAIDTTNSDEMKPDEKPDEKPE